MAFAGHRTPVCRGGNRRHCGIVAYTAMGGDIVHISSKPWAAKLGKGPGEDGSVSTSNGGGAGA